MMMLYNVVRNYLNQLKVHPAVVVKRITLFAIALMSIASLYIAGTLPLSPDEAHYALYGRFLDLSYFDHPPMVGWVQSITLLLSDHELALRIPALLCSIATGWMLFYITHRQFGETSAWLALFVFIVTPMFRLLGLVWIPDAPLMLIGLGTLYFTQLVCEENHWKYWLGLGLCLGLAALSKYTAVTLAFSAAVILLLNYGWRVLLAPGLWLMTLIAALFVLPVLVWNYQHDWISFLYQIDHGAGKSKWSFMNALRMQLQQMGTYGIAVYIGLFGATIWSLRENKHRNYMIFAWPMLLLFSILSAKGRSLPHWTALGILYMLPVIASWLIHIWPSIKHRFWLIPAGVVSLVVPVVMVLTLTGVNLVGDKGFKMALQDFVGWNHVASHTRTLAEADEAGYQQLFIPNWSHGSRVAWYARPLPLKILDSRIDQFDLWFGNAENGDNGYLILHEEKGRYNSDLLELFSQCEPAYEYKADLSDITINHFKVYRCTDYEYPKSR